MACYDCELCKYEGGCIYTNAYPECYIITIKNARAIVDDEFRTFYSKLKNRASDLYDNHIDYVVESMRTLIYDSNQYVPDWAMEEDF